MFGDAIRIKLPSTALPTLDQLGRVIFLNFYSVLTVYLLDVALFIRIALISVWVLTVVVLLFMIVLLAVILRTVVVLLPVILLSIVLLLALKGCTLVRRRLMSGRVFFIPRLWSLFAFLVVIAVCGLGLLVVVFGIVLLHLLIDILVRPCSAIVALRVVVISIFIARDYMGKGLLLEGACL